MRKVKQIGRCSVPRACVLSRRAYTAVDSRRCQRRCRCQCDTHGHNVLSRARESVSVCVFVLINIPRIIINTFISTRVQTTLGRTTLTNLHSEHSPPATLPIFIDRITAAVVVAYSNARSRRAAGRQRGAATRDHTTMTRNVLHLFACTQRILRAWRLFCGVNIDLQ